jgi:phenylpropionate dioxygenase-like ring-hydroxylating dioxygenase large terminal subunit
VLSVDDDITRARTPPGEFYRDPAVFAALRDRVLARTWAFVADAARVAAPASAAPCRLDALDAPLVITRDAGGALHALSNVCTHRANLVCAEDGPAASLRCRYHGRRFALDGRFQSMPEFDGVRDFPSERDDLPRVALARLGPLLFASLAPAHDFDAAVAPIRARMPWLDWDALVPDPAAARDYDVRAPFAHYCENYLEGFHIPYLHAALHEALDYGAYDVELHEHASLQLGIARAPSGHDGGDDAFAELDAGRRVAGYYWFLFPTTMLNVYPWGLSLNVVTPLAIDRTRVTFRAYVLDAARRGRGAGADLDRVEREDETVVERVQEGVRSRLYRGGRYSPSRERAVHHFHRALARWLT